jgi:Flp pilus assembly pilin Flp
MPERGTHDGAQVLIEYGLIIALVAVLAIAGLVIFGPAISNLLSKLGGPT